MRAQLYEPVHDPVFRHLLDDANTLKYICHVVNAAFHNIESLGRLVQIKHAVGRVIELGTKARRERLERGIKATAARRCCANG